MTEHELEIVKLKSQMQALQLVVRVLCSALGRTFPTFGPSLLETGKHAQEEYSKIALKGYPPELSDLIAGEYQEALDDLLKYIEDGLVRDKDKGVS
jgi:hypothetical protein